MPWTDYDSCAIRALKKDLFKAQASSSVGNIEASRRGAYELAANNPPEADVHFLDELLGGLPAVRVWASGASKDRAIYYLHGGGFILGAPATQLGMLGEFSRAANAHVVALDYSKASESKFPVAYEQTIQGLRAMQRAQVPFAVAGDSAGGGLALSAAISAAQDGPAVRRSPCSVPGWT